MANEITTAVIIFMQETPKAQGPYFRRLVPLKTKLAVVGNTKRSKSVVLAAIPLIKKYVLFDLVKNTTLLYHIQMPPYFPFLSLKWRKAFNHR